MWIDSTGDFSPDRITPILESLDVQVTLSIHVHRLRIISFSFSILRLFSIGFKSVPVLTLMPYSVSSTRKPIPTSLAFFS